MILRLGVDIGGTKIAVVVLDAGGRHVWVQEGKPTQAPASFGCGSAGQICGFDGITVRQGNASTATMLGYAWRGQNLSGGGDVGQQALLNADVPSAGYILSTRAGNAVAGLPIALSRGAGGAITIPGTCGH